MLFETWGITRFPVSDGRSLEVSAGTLAGEMSLGFEFRDPEKMLPTDAIACDFRTTDHQGQVWSTISRFTTRLFITHMFDLSHHQHMNLFRPEEAGEEYQRAFERTLLLADARFSCDDRFHRTLLVGDRLIVTQFKYTAIHFDVAVVQDDSDPSYLTEFAVRIHAESLWDEDAEDIGELGYYMSCLHALRNNTGLYDPHWKGWRDSPLPMPLVFTPTAASGTPQENVRVVG
jgi:hypothetical protein